MAPYMIPYLALALAMPRVFASPARPLADYAGATLRTIVGPSGPRRALPTERKRLVRTSSTVWNWTRKSRKSA